MSTQENSFNSSPSNLSLEIPQDELNEAFEVNKQQASPLQNALPLFTPPFDGLTITSSFTGNTYTIGKKIGEGFFGEVFEATDIWRNELAVKVLKPIDTYEKVQNAATSEFGKLLHLRHPNVTFVMDAFEFNNTFYIITEKCFAPIEGLFSMQTLTGRLWILPIARCLLQAVHFLHISGYVHQDIHSGNVFMAFHRNEMGDQSSDTVTFKLGDLGITKLSNEIDAQNTVLNANIFPPEFLDKDSFGALNRTVDIYHCGLLFLQLYLGKQLSFTEDEILAGVPRKMAEELPPPFNYAISKALRRTVSMRTQSALEFWTDLNSETP